MRFGMLRLYEEKQGNLKTETKHKAKHLNHKSNQVVRRLQEVEHNGEMSTLRQRGCLTLQMFLLQRILLRRASPPRKPCVPRILESKSPKGRGPANHCRKRAYETIIQIYHHLRPPTYRKNLLVQHNRTQTLNPWNVSRLGRRLILHPIHGTNRSCESCNSIHPEFFSP